MLRVCLAAKSADEVGVQTIQGFDGESFNLVIHNGATDLAQTAEYTLNDHLVTFTDFRGAETDYFERAGLILKQEPVGRLTLAIRRQLHIHDLSGDDDILMVVLFRMGEKLGNFDQASRRGKRRRAEQTGQAQAEQQNPCGGKCAGMGLSGGWS